MLIAVVGDVHYQWSGADAQALDALGVDLVLFVGDFGNEAIELVRQVAQVSLPKAVILGNHDAWYVAGTKHRKRCPYDLSREDRVQQQLEVLGECHVGFGKLELPDQRVTVIGGRPFSWGGSKWRHGTFYRDRYHVNNFEESAAKINETVATAQQETLIFLGHNGPIGLGDQVHDICGRDWKRKGGDYGDPDFAEAIATAHATHRNVPLVVFGHMHHELKYDKTRLRQRVVVDDHGTVYVNGAQVPRVIDTEEGNRRSFTLITLQAGMVETVRLVWLNPQHSVVSEEYLYKTCGAPPKPSGRVDEFGLA
ncbi:MAG: TIGR04168 family protein [Cyanobacteria bacterium J06642_11]